AFPARASVFQDAPICSRSEPGIRSNAAFEAPQLHQLEGELMEQAVGGLFGCRQQIPDDSLAPRAMGPIVDFGQDQAYRPENKTRQGPDQDRSKPPEP